MSFMSLISAQQIEQFHELGYFVTPPLFNQQQLDAVASELDRLWTQCTRDADVYDTICARALALDTEYFPL